MKPPHPFLGELLGTFLLVFFGCGAVANAVIFEAYTGLFQIAAIWGIGLTIAITITGPMSGAHLNPAISIALAVVDSFPKRWLPLYLAAQLLGAFLAAALLYVLFSPGIAAFESAHDITRGASGSEASARIFGEFHPTTTPVATAFLAEFLGTALLAFIIFTLTDKRREKPLPTWLIPPAIGATLTLLISLFAPLSMAGFNPARDFAPRLLSILAGWGEIPFVANGPSWWLTYLTAPILGAIIGGLIAKRLPVSD